MPVAILDQPNVGKSTLLNTLINEDRAIVSEIAGTTGNTEDTLIIGGVQFRFIDTAGLRETDDITENIGIKKALDKAKTAQIAIFIIDATQHLNTQLEELNNLKTKGLKNHIVVVNKIDLKPSIKSEISQAIFISAKKKEGIQKINHKLLEMANASSIGNNTTLVSNNRHLEALNKALENVSKTMDGLNKGISGDFLAMDIRQALYHIGEITGEISNDDLLENIFSNFCIGK